LDALDAVPDANASRGRRWLCSLDSATEFSSGRK